MSWRWCLLVVALGCKHDESKQPAVAPAPPRDAARPIDAVATPDAAAPAPDAAQGAMLITPDGVGPLKTGIDTSTVASLFPGLTARTEHDEAEDHNYDVITLSRGKQHVIDAVIDNMNEAPALFRVDVYDGSLATAAGARVTSTVKELATMYPDVACLYEKYDDNAEGWTTALFCVSKSLPNISFQLDPQTFKGRKGPVPVAKLATRTLQRIIWKP